MLCHLIDRVEALTEDAAHLALADEGIGVDGAHKAENLGTLVLAGNGGNHFHRLFAIAALGIQDGYAARHLRHNRLCYLVPLLAEDEELYRLARAVHHPVHRRGGHEREAKTE